MSLSTVSVPVPGLVSMPVSVPASYQCSRYEERRGQCRVTYKGAPSRRPLSDFAPWFCRWASCSAARLPTTPSRPPSHSKTARACAKPRTTLTRPSCAGARPRALKRDALAWGGTRSQRRRDRAESTCGHVVYVDGNHDGGGGGGGDSNG